VNLRVESFVVGPLPNNLYLLMDDATREIVVVDPSIGSEPALARVRDLQREGYVLRAIWNTHGHFDHVYDNAVWQAEFGVPLAMHRADEPFLQRLQEQSLWMGMPAPQPAQPDVWLEEGQTLRVGNCAARVLHTPGHSPGSVSFVFDDENLCLSGDVLFRGSIGRTDLPGCSFPVLQQSLLTLSRLPAETRILSGHGEETTIAIETATNQFYKPILSRHSEEKL
jgi:glyoxylase-like metal-dependent hydrolase (beta-lactamase superfamily II)